MNLANCLRETEDGGHGFNQHFQCCVGVMAHGGRQRNEPLVERFRRPGFVFCGLKGRMVIAAGSPEISFRTRLGHHWLGVGVGSGAPQTLKWPGRGETTPRPPFADAFVGWVPLPCPTPVKAAQSPVRLGKYQVRTPSSEVAVTWPAAGSVDTEIGCFREPEASDAEAQVQSRVQDRGGTLGA